MAVASATLLHQKIAAVCPISSVRVIRANDHTTWSFTALPSATPAQLAAAQNVINTFDLVAAKAAVETLTSSYAADATLQNIMNTLAGATPTQVVNFVNNNSNADAGTKQILAKILLILGQLVNT